MTNKSVHIACRNCQAINRVPVERLAEDPTCGKCGTALLDGRTFELTDADFDAITARTEVPILVDFWAPWCGPCHAMAPHYEKAAVELKGRALLAKVNSDENPRLASRFGIRSIPTLVRLAAGQEAARQTGAVQTAQIVLFAR